MAELFRAARAAITTRLIMTAMTEQIPEAGAVLVCLVKAVMAVIMVLIQKKAELGVFQEYPLAVVEAEGLITIQVMGLLVETEG
jgi:hypothetical protein